MKPVHFKEANVIYKAEGYLDLPTHKGENQIISCWVPDEEELQEIKNQIENGEVPKIYLSIYGQQQPPVWVSGITPFEECKEECTEHESKQ